MDGGQSGAVALIGNEEGRVVGVGRGVSVQAALGNAQVADTVFESVCFGLSGGAEGKDALVRELVKSARYRIEHDAWVALAGATAGEPGIVVIAGTGSSVGVRKEPRESHGARGWLGLRVWR